MEPFLPSEIARLVYGYLKKEKNEVAAECFLRTSPLLKECYQMFLAKRNFNNKVNGFSLDDVFDNFGIICSMIDGKMSAGYESKTVIEKLQYILDTSHASQYARVDKCVETDLETNDKCVQQQSNCQNNSSSMLEESQLVNNAATRPSVEQSPISSFEKNTSDKFFIAHSTPCTFPKTKLNDITNIVPNITSEIEENLIVSPQKISSPSKRVEETKNCPSPKSHQIHPTNSFHGLGDLYNPSLLDKSEIHQIPEATPLEAMPGLLKECKTLTSSVNNTFQGKRKLFRKIADTTNKSVDVQKETYLSLIAQNTQNLSSSSHEKTLDSTQCNPQIDNLLEEFLIFNGNTVNGNKDVELNCIKSRLRNSKKKYGSMKINKKKSCIRTKNIKSCKKIDSNIILINECHEKQSSFENCEGYENQVTIKSNLSTSLTPLFNCTTSSAVSALDSDKNPGKSDFVKITPSIKPMDLGPRLSQCTYDFLPKSMDNVLEDAIGLKSQSRNPTDVDVQTCRAAEFSRLIQSEQNADKVIENITFSHVSKEALVVNEINAHDTPDDIQKPPKTKSMSTPRRRSTHIRTLDFSTPQPKKKAIEQARSKLFCDSPKRILSILEESLTNSPMPKLEGNWGAVNGFESIVKKYTIVDGSKSHASNTVGSEIVTVDTCGRETKKSSRKGRTPKKNVKCVQNIDVVCDVTNENIIDFDGSNEINGKAGDEPVKLNMCLNEKDNLDEPIDVGSALKDQQMSVHDELAVLSENNARLTNTINVCSNRGDEQEDISEQSDIPAGNLNKSLNDNSNASTECNHKSSEDLVQSNLLLNNIEENESTVKNDENQLLNDTSDIISDIAVTADTEKQEAEKSVSNCSKTPERLDNLLDYCCSTSINKSTEKIPQQNDNNITHIHTFNVPNEVEKINERDNDSHLFGTTNENLPKNDVKTITSDTNIYLPSLSTGNVSKNDQDEHNVKLQNYTDVAEIISSINASNTSSTKHNVAKTPYKCDESTVVPETPISKMLREYDPSKLVTPIPATPVHNEDSLTETPLTKIFRETSYLNRPPISPFPPTPGNSQSVDIGLKPYEQQQQRVTEKPNNKIVETVDVGVDKPKELLTQIPPPMKTTTTTTNSVTKTPPTAKKKKPSPLKVKFKPTLAPQAKNNVVKRKKSIVKKTQIYESVKVELFGNNTLTSSSDDDDDEADKPQKQSKSLIIKKKPSEDERTSGFKPIPRRKSIQDTTADVNDTKRRSSSAERGPERCTSEQIERNNKKTKTSLDNNKPSAVRCGMPELIETGKKCTNVANEPYACNPIEKKLKTMDSKVKSSRLNNSSTKNSRKRAENKLSTSGDSSKSKTVNKSKNTDLRGKKATNTPSCSFNQSDSKQDSECEMSSSCNVSYLLSNSSKTFANVSLNKSNPSESSSMSFTSSANNTLSTSNILSDTTIMDKIKNEPMVYEIITEDDEREMVHLYWSPTLALFDLPSEINSKSLISNSPLTLSSCKPPAVKTSKIEVGELVDDENTFVSSSLPSTDVIDRKNSARRSPSYWEDSVHNYPSKHKTDRGKESNRWREKTRKDDRYDAKSKYRSNNYRTERVPTDKNKYQNNYNTPTGYKREDRPRGQERYKMCEEDRKRNYHDSHNSYEYKSRKRFEESERRVSSSHRMFQNNSQHFGGEDFVKKATKRSSDRFDYSQIPPKKMYKSDHKRY